MNLFQAAAVAALLVAAPAVAQTTHDHQSPPATPAPQASPGMMGQGMMHGQGATGTGMMHGQGTQGGMGSRMSGMGRTAGIDRLEGRLAFIKTELKITDAQLPAWNAFAEAVRGNAQTMKVEQQAMHGRVGTGVSLPDRLLAQANAFTAHAEEMTRFKAALDPLYASLSAEQKKTADEIVLSPMGVPVGMM